MYTLHKAQLGVFFSSFYFFFIFFLKQPYDAIFSLFFDDARSTEFFKCTKGAADFGPDKRIFFFILFESMSMMMVVGPPGWREAKLLAKLTWFFSNP